jgi:hypothetical protein
MRPLTAALALLLASASLLGAAPLVIPGASNAASAWETPVAASHIVDGDEDDDDDDDDDDEELRGVA